MRTVVSAAALKKNGRGLMATLRENFAANLKRLIRVGGMTQRTFAEKLGVPEASVSRWTNMINFPEDTMVDRIVATLDVSYEEVFRDPSGAASDPLVGILRDVLKTRGYDIVKKKS